jgi:anti-anti-sigma regulatory factor
MHADEDSRSSVAAKPPAAAPPSLERQVDGNAAFYRISGKFDGSCAWDLSDRLQGEPYSEVVVDFSQANDFVDCAVGVIAATLLTSRKRIRLRGLRQHQERLFGYFGVDPSDLGRAHEPISGASSAPSDATKEVA